MNPGPGLGGGPGVDGASIAQTVVMLLVLGGVVVLGVLVLRRLGTIERAVRGEPVRAAATRVAPPVAQPAQATDADQRAWQQQPPVMQAEQAAPQQPLREGPAPA